MLQLGFIFHLILKKKGHTLVMYLIFSPLNRTLTPNPPQILQYYPSLALLKYSLGDCSQLYGHELQWQLKGLVKIRPLSVKDNLI